MSVKTIRTLEEQFIDFAEALKLARKGDGSKLPIEDIDDKVGKTSLLILDGFVVYTLTKNGNVFQHQRDWCQFRVWVRKGWLRKDRPHVDEYGHGCIFNVLGPFDELKSLAEKHLTERLYMMEDGDYVVWL
jgi:hypothetical protein